MHWVWPRTSAALRCSRMKAKNLILGGAALLLAASATAQVKCKMPNGVTITKQLGDCPHDAVAAFTLDGKPLPKPSETPEGRTRAAQAQEAKKRKADGRKAKEDAANAERMKLLDEEVAQLKKQRDIDAQKRRQRVRDEACNVLRLPQHRCETDYSWRYGDSVIISTHQLPADIDSICRNYASAIRKSLLESRLGSGWSIRINFSPTGKTISECQV